MKVSTEKQINGSVAKALRENSGKSQKDFWRSVGVTQSGGCRYEGGASIPQAVRQLLFIFYVAELKFNTSTEEGAKALVELGKLQASIRAKEKVKIGETLQKVISHIESAQHELQQL